MSYATVYETLSEAIKLGPHQQIALVRAVDEAYALLDAEDLGDEQTLALRVLIAHAEGLIGRYFGM